MPITVTSSSLPFETRSRWEQGSPGGYVSGHMTLPSSRCLVSLDCLQSTENSSSLCTLHLPIFDCSGNRVKECLQHPDKSVCPAGSECKKAFRDTIGGNSSKVIVEVDGTNVWATQVMGEGKEARKDVTVAKVIKDKGGQARVDLGMFNLAKMDNLTRPFFPSIIIIKST